MRRVHLLSTSAAAAMMLSTVAAQAADAFTPPTESDWQITVAPYVWAAGIKGESGLFGLPAQDVDISFIDTLKDLEFTFSGVTEMRKGRLTISTDVLYGRVGPDIDTPVGAADIDATVITFMGTGLIGYSAVMTDTTTIDLVAGARVWSAKNEFDVTGGVFDGRSPSDGDTWVDPVVGVKFKADVSEKIYLAGWGLVGGFGVGSDIMWDAMGGMGYRINDKMTMFAGYRGLHDDYSKDGFVSKITQTGPIIGGTFDF
ncbi:MAG: hypothetical protein JNM45_17130 [Rhizobiales bacterium]|nr:hypothetical protein [Hyphomicrobiales bacterium]